VAEWHSDSRGGLSGVVDTIANPAVEPMSKFMSMPPSVRYVFFWKHEMLSVLNYIDIWKVESLLIIVQG
jgi:hypothetical protein